MVGEAVEIADGGEDVARDRLRVDTRFKVAAKWNKERYGEGEGLGAGLENLAMVLQRISERKRELVIENVEPIDESR